MLFYYGWVQYPQLLMISHITQKGVMTFLLRARMYVGAGISSTRSVFYHILKLGFFLNTFYMFASIYFILFHSLPLRFSLFCTYTHITIYLCLFKISFIKAADHSIFKSYIYYLLDPILPYHRTHFSLTKHLTCLSLTNTR